MPEPTTTTLATVGAQALAVPILTIAGIPLGLRADELLAGFAGAVSAMALLNSVPGTGDSWQAMLKTTFKRVGVAIGSAMTAGYLVPLGASSIGASSAWELGVSFVVGAGAQQLLKAAIERTQKRIEQ